MGRNGKRITAVLFDLDDTLLDWSGVAGGYDEVVRPHVDNVHAYLTAQGHALPDPAAFYARYRATVNDHWRVAKQTWNGVSFARVLRDAFTACGLNAERIDLQAVMRAYDVQPVPGVTLFDDAQPVLRALKEAGYKLGLITNAMLPMWMRDVELRAYQILDYFDSRVTSGDVGYIKPHPAIYQQVLDTLQATPQQAVFVGDRPANDIAGANNLGLVSVLISPPHLERELKDVTPDHIITSLSELPPLLARLEA